jgi:hypothetical protein
MFFFFLLHAASGKDFLELLISHVKSLEQRIDSAIKGWEASVGEIETRFEARVSALEHHLHAIGGLPSSYIVDGIPQMINHNHNDPSHIHPHVAHHHSNLNQSTANAHITHLNGSNNIILDSPGNQFFPVSSPQLSALHNTNIHTHNSLMIKLENENSNDNSSLRVSANFHTAFLEDERHQLTLSQDFLSLHKN